MRAAVHPDQEARLEALRSYNVLDTPDEGDFDEIVALAAQICGTPMSLVSLVDADRQWFKAKVGLDASQTGLEGSICSHAILGHDLFEIADTTQDGRTADNPLVLGDPNLRFYAGIPLETPDGLPLGSLCVLDTVPRHLTDAQRNALRVLGHQVMTQLELRRKVRELEFERAARERSDVRARDDRDFIQLVTSRLPIRVGYVDRAYRYLFVNDAYERELGLASKDIIGKTVAEALGDIAFASGKSALDRALAGEGFTHEIEVPYRQGTRWVRTTFVPDHDERGGVRGIVIQVADISEELRAQRTLETERTRLEELLDKAPAFTALLEGPELTFTFVNDEYLKLIGHREVIGLPVREALPEIAGQGFFELLDGVVATGESFRGVELPIQLQREPGCEPEERFVDFLYQAMRNADGEAYGVFAHGVDVTEGVLARKAITEREELFRTVFEQAPDDAIILMDAERTLTAWNPAAERITGWTAAEAIGQPADLIFTPEDRATGVPEKEIGGAALRGKSADERWHIRKDGERFWGSGTMNALHDENGSVRGYLKVFRDGTRRHRLLQGIAALNDELEAKVLDRTVQLQEAVKEAEGFNYSIAHDLRTPLRAIASTAAILMEDLGPDLSLEHRNLLQRQGHNANRLGTLIDELLRLSRLARAEIKRQLLDMTGMAKNVASELERSCEVEVQEGMFASGDPVLIRSVLENLVGNACKFSPAGGAVQVGETDGTFWVRDHGIGFDMAHAKRMFLPFERLVADSEFPGTGIGLANVERIVKRHGGRVWAESIPGEGATFSFTLG